MAVFFLFRPTSNSVRTVWRVTNIKNFSGGSRSLRLWNMLLSLAFPASIASKAFLTALSVESGRLYVQRLT